MMVSRNYSILGLDSFYVNYIYIYIFLCVNYIYIIFLCRYKKKQISQTFSFKPVIW
jgi:hypothetical protein